MKTVTEQLSMTKTWAQWQSAGETPTDAQLLSAIAEFRDQKSFEELLRRYESQAYGIAFHITGRRHTAEDVVQEAMVNVWNSAGNYRGEGPVRAWLLSTVAHIAIRAIKSQKRPSTPVEHEELMANDDVSPENSAESSELSEALRREFTQLPDSDRQLVALHFAGGLSQNQISDALSIPQQTVSYRINKTLKQLRTQLAAAGYATALPFLAGGALGTALSSGVQTPTGLRSRIMKQCGPQSSVTGHRRQVSAAKSNTGLWAAMGFLALAAAVGAWFTTFNHPAQPLAPAQPIAPAATPTIPTLPDAAEPEDEWRHQWTFDKPPSSDLKTIDLVWNAETKSLDAKGFGRIFPEYWMTGRPLLFTLTGRYFKNDSESGGNAWFINSTGTVVAKHSWGGGITTRPDDAITEKLYVYRGKVAGLLNDKVSWIADFDIDFAHTVICLSLKNFSLQELTVRPLNDDELPDFLIHPEKYVKDMRPIDPNTGALK
jgi:RNA polymerase sigma factor (sigma-70 family)